jgi:hypothetical protein
VTTKIGEGKNSNKLCLLMFTRDNFRDAVNKAIRYSDSFDLAVIIDSSSRPPDQLPKMLEQKIKIYRAFSPGHIEPLLHYGTQKALDLGCSYVVRIDVDEELSEHLLRDIRDIVGYCDTYTLKSLIHVEGYPHIVHEYYHPRIFRPEKVSFNGIIHTSEAHAEGKICFLDDQKYFLIHKLSVEDLSIEDVFKKRLRRYLTIESFERPAVPRYLLLYHFPGGKRIIKRILAKISPLLLSIPPPQVLFSLYQRLSEILLVMLNRLAKKPKYHETNTCPDQTPLLLCPNVFERLYVWAKYRYMVRLDKREVITRVKIADEIHRSGGVISFLCLDREDIVNRITEIAGKIRGFGGVEFFSILLTKIHFRRLLIR